MPVQKKKNNIAKTTSIMEKNAKIYIAEINSHKKSIFEFWKFANKDELPGLNEGELDENENDKIKKLKYYNN